MKHLFRMTTATVGFALTWSSLSAQPVGILNPVALRPTWLGVALAVALAGVGLAWFRRNAVPGTVAQSGATNMVRLRWPEAIKLRFSHHPFPPPAAPSPKPVTPIQQLTAERLQQLDEKQFEGLVRGYFTAVGFRAEPRQGDSDSYLYRRDAAQPFGLVRCHCRVHEVGSQTVDEVRGILEAEKLPEGYVVAASGFSAEARSGITGNQLLLLDAPLFVLRVNRLPKPLRVALLAQLNPSEETTPATAHPPPTARE